MDSFVQDLRALPDLIGVFCFAIAKVFLPNRENNASTSLPRASKFAVFDLRIRNIRIIPYTDSAAPIVKSPVPCAANEASTAPSTEDDTENEVNTASPENAVPSADEPPAG